MISSYIHVRLILSNKKTMIIILEGHSDYDTHMCSVKVRSKISIYIYRLILILFQLQVRMIFLATIQKKYHGFHTAKK